MIRLLQDFNTLRFLTSHDVTSGIRTRTFVWKCMEIRVLLGLSANKEAYWSTFVFLSSNIHVWTSIASVVTVVYSKQEL